MKTLLQQLFQAEVESQFPKINVAGYYFYNSPFRPNYGIDYSEKIAEGIMSYYHTTDQYHTCSVCGKEKQSYLQYATGLCVCPHCFVKSFIGQDLSE